MYLLGFHLNGVYNSVFFTVSYDIRSNQGWLWGLIQKISMRNCFINLLTQLLQTGLLSLGRENEDIRCSMILKELFLMPDLHVGMTNTGLCHPRTSVYWKNLPMQA